MPMQELATDRSFNMAVSFQDWSWARKTGIGGKSRLLHRHVLFGIYLSEGPRERFMPGEKKFAPQSGTLFARQHAVDANGMGGGEERGCGYYGDRREPEGCFQNAVAIASAEDPLTLSLSPQARLGEVASQRGRIRKRMRLGERTLEHPRRVIRASLLPVRARLRVRQQKMQARPGVLARRRTG